MTIPILAISEVDRANNLRMVDRNSLRDELRAEHLARFQLVAR